MFESTRQLKKSQLRDLDEFLRRCRITDGGSPSVYRPLLLQLRDTENTILYYHKKKLAGFLGVYFFYQDACEISMLVAPGLRRGGIARRMLQSIFPLLRHKEFNGQRFCFTIDLLASSYCSQISFNFPSAFG